MAWKQYKDLQSVVAWGPVSFEQGKKEHGILEKEDIFWKIRHLHDVSNDCLRLPVKYVTTLSIDEKMLGYQGKCPKIIYCKEKPVERGMKLFVANDGNNG